MLNCLKALHLSKNSRAKIKQVSDQVRRTSVKLLVTILNVLFSVCGLKEVLSCYNIGFLRKTLVEAMEWKQPTRIVAL